MPDPIAAAGGIEVSRTLLPQWGLGISFQASSTLRPFPAKGQEHSALMDTAWDWETGILGSSDAAVLGSNMQTVC